MAQPDSDLVIIDDEEELAFLRNRTAEINETKDWWIGMYCFIYISVPFKYSSPLIGLK